MSSEQMCLITGFHCQALFKSLKLYKILFLGCFKYDNSYNKEYCLSHNVPDFNQN